MSRLLFKNHEYSLAELIELRRKSHLYKSGDVTDLDDGETLDIQEIDIWRTKYFDELMDIGRKYGTKNSAILTGAIRKEVDAEIEKELQEKFKKGAISNTELEDLIERKLKNRKIFELNFSSFYIRNKKKDYPDILSFNDIGRYEKLLKYLTKYSDLRNSNRKDSKPLKNIKITDMLELSEKRFFQYMNKMQRVKMLKYIKEDNGDLVIFINPVYSYMRGKIDYTIYTLFKSDIEEYLMPEEIEYLKRQFDGDKIRYTNRLLSRDV